MVVHAGGHLLLAVDACCQASDSSAARSRFNSGAGVMNEEEPQSRQTRSLGNTKTPSSSEFLRPEKRMFTSAGNSVWLLEAQNEQAKSDPSRGLQVRRQDCKKKHKCTSKRGGRCALGFERSTERSMLNRNRSVGASHRIPLKENACCCYLIDAAGWLTLRFVKGA